MAEGEGAGFSGAVERFERRILPYALWLVPAIYAILKFVDNELKVSGWEFPLILISLAVLLRLADQSRSKLIEESDRQRRKYDSLLENLQELRVLYERSEAKRTAKLSSKLGDATQLLTTQQGRLDRIQELLATRSYLRVYDTAHEFFLGLNLALMQSESRVWVTYVREGPPDEQVGEGQDYFSACERWASEPGHTFRRIIYCDPTSDSMRDWVAVEHLKTLDPALHFAIRVWPDRATDRMSIALFDDKWVFCSFVSDRDELQAFSVQNASVISHFRGFYQRLWDLSLPTSQFLSAGVSSNRSSAPVSPPPSQP